MPRAPIVALLSLLGTWLFFLEYAAPLRRVLIPYDMGGYHYPLAQYAFQSLKDGRFPQWDPSIYCGLPFAANVQVALFYPPTWLLFAANWTRDRLPFESLQDFVLLHVWLAFLLAYLWLRRRDLHPLAATLGALVFACSGYMMTQLQHLGLVCGLAWWPLAFLGIDDVARHCRWRPAWKIAAASAMVFLSGYTPFWAAFALIAAGYAAATLRPKAMLATAAALFFSVALVAIQLLPAMEASRMMVRENRYGHGFQDPLFFIAYLIPNYWDFGLHKPVDTNPLRDYWYLGASGIAGIAAALLTRSLLRALPALGIAAVTFLFAVNPGKIVSSILNQPSLLSQLLRDWYFLAGFTAAAALLAATGWDALFQRDRPRTLPTWPAIAAAAAAVAWCVRILYLWSPGGTDFGAGLATLFETSISIALLAALAFTFIRSTGAARGTAAAAIVLLAVVEFKAFGTAKRFNATKNKMVTEFANPGFPGLDPALLRQLQNAPPGRVGLDPTGPFPLDLRHAGLITPQGFDPFVPSQYRTLIERYTRFTSDREFDLSKVTPELLRLLGVRHWLTARPAAPLEGHFLPSRQLLPDTSYFKLWELIDAPPPYVLEGPGTAKHLEWRPEHRVFDVNSQAGGTFRLSEQFYPGWTATIDGQSVPIARCHDALQCIPVSAGSHRLEFRFQSASLRNGALISLASLIALAVFLRRA